MSLDWPDLELLRRGRGDLLALSPLSRKVIRKAMLDALHGLETKLAWIDGKGPGIAIIDALAACIEVMGFYHDRFVTESKLGSAQLLEDVARITALIGHRPQPSVAATAFQFFEAVAAGTVAPQTRVAGKIRVPPSTVTFETDALIEVSPELNRMELSPLLTLQAGARRAILTLLTPGCRAASSSPDAAQIAAQQDLAGRGVALVTDDFRPRSTPAARTFAVVGDSGGLELAAIEDSRRGGVGFARGLSRNFDLASAVVSRATVIRRLGGPCALADDLVAYEVSEAPILHLPSVEAPEVLSSTLEIFVLRPGDDVRDPSEWDPALRYAEVTDFSGSEVSDLHYRTFVDDALHTWIILRRKLGARTLLDDQALRRVHARFVPAIGSVLAGDPDDLTARERRLRDATLGLDAGYFETSLVVPPMPGAQLQASATWAMVDRDLGLGEGAAILIQGAGGKPRIRTLIDRPAGSSARLLCWAAPAPAKPDGAPDARTALDGPHDPIGDVLDPASTRIGSIADAATGPALPTWSEFYAQLEPPGPYVAAASDFPIVPATPSRSTDPSRSNGTVDRERIVAAGSTYLVVAGGSHIAAGDFLIVGQRLTEDARAPRLSGPWRWRSGEPRFDPRAPWLDAEIVQVLEVRGNVVRLAAPLSQDYFIHWGQSGEQRDLTALSEVFALPGVVSVASGDRLRQTLTLSAQSLFRGQDGDLYEASYAIASVDTSRHRTLVRELRTPLLSVTRPEFVVSLPGPSATPPPIPKYTARSLWDRLFVAVAGVAEAQTRATWAFTVRIEALGPLAHLVSHLEDPGGMPVVTDERIKVQLDRGYAISVDTVEAAARIAAANGSVIAVVDADARQTWKKSDRTPDAGEFQIIEITSFDLVPDPASLASEALLGEGGTLILLAPQRTDDHQLRFDWDRSARAVRVSGARPMSGPVEALVMPANLGVPDLAAVAARQPTPGPAWASADWLVPTSRFEHPAFYQLPAGHPLPAGTLVVAAGEQIVFEHRFAADPHGLALGDVAIDGPASIVDPLRGGAAAWAVLSDGAGDAPITVSAALARWTYQLGPSDPGRLPLQANIRMALAGARRVIVPARTGADGRSAVIEDRDALWGDLGFPLDALYGLNDRPIAGSRITGSTIGVWRNVAPPLAEPREAESSRLVAVLPRSDGSGLRTIAWQRDEVLWDPERRTLRLPIENLASQPGARVSEVVRLLQVLAPQIDRRQFSLHHDLTTDRTLLTLWMTADWPGGELAPAPVVVATLAEDGSTEIRDMVAPVDVVIDPRGRVRWTLPFSGDLRDRWTDVGLVLRDWQAPVERGLTTAPLWRVPATDWPAEAPQRPVTSPVTLPVTLIATTRESVDFLALEALGRRNGDVVELVPLGRDDEFPIAASVDQVHVAAYAMTAATSQSSLVLDGTTILELDAAAVQRAGLGDLPVTSVVFVDGLQWRPIDVTRGATSDGGGQRYELEGSYLSLFPEGIARAQQVRLCYGTSRLVPSAVATAARTLRLRLPGLGTAGLGTAGVTANTAVFHDQDLHASGRRDRIVLGTASAPTVNGDTLVVELALAAGDLGAIFDEDGKLRRRGLALGQRWQGATLEPQPVRIQLGSSFYGEVGPNDTAIGDIFELGFGTADRVRAVALRYDPGHGVLDLVPDPVLAPEQLGKLTDLTLYGLQTWIDPVEYAATLTLVPSSPQPPWFLSFTNDPGVSSVLVTLLPYTEVKPVSGGDGQAQQFRFARDPATLPYIFQNAASTLYLFTNERDELRRDFYTRSTGELVNDLVPPSPVNFLDPGVPDSTPIDQLLLTSSAWAGKDLVSPRPIVLGWKDWKPASDDPPRIPPELFPELWIASVKPGRVPTSVVLQSARFNSGSFIAAEQDTTTGDTAAILAAALRVSALPVDRNANPIGTWRTVDPVPLTTMKGVRDQLAGAAKGPTDATAALEGLTRRDAVETVVKDGPKYQFAASFAAAGACTLHFQFVDKALIETVHVRIEMQYEVDAARTGSGLANPIYPLETRVLGFDPKSQLALVAPGPLKPDALVFVRYHGTQPELQCTRVQGVSGSIVTVDPPIAYPPRIEPVEVTTLGTLQSAARLDLDYYETVGKAKLAPAPDPAGASTAGSTDPDQPTWWRLPLRDRLPLDVVARPQDGDGDASLIASLVPGDPVLVFDERYRTAWAEARDGSSSGGRASAVDWKQWPDFQHQAAVKQVDVEAGLLVLDAPLPDRFQIRWRLDPRPAADAARTPRRLTAQRDDIAALRVLPHHRAPIQGRRRLAVLGSGDSTRRFARLVSSLDGETGSAVIPLAASGVMTGNLEVISFDPEKRTWTRWLRYDRLSRADKKAAAYRLGFRAAQDGPLPVSIEFGDGITGQRLPTGVDNVYLRSTRIGAASSWLARRRKVRIFPAPLATPSTDASPALAAASPAALPERLRLRLASTAPADLGGGGELGSTQWRQVIELTVAMTGGGTLAFHEITQAERAGGKHGFMVISKLEAPPGVVDVAVYARDPIELPAVTAWQVPGSRQWALDQRFYDALAGSDLTAKPGATSLQLLSTTGLRQGSRLALFPDPDQPPEIARIASIDPPTWSATLEQPLARVYDLARSSIRGNVASIVQGTVEQITIGSSDGSTASLRLPLPPSPLLYLAGKPGTDPVPDVTVFVRTAADDAGGSSLQPWDRVLDFEDRNPSNRVWRLDVDPAGLAFVVFGDGKRGAIPPAGRDNIEARIRLGSGAAGNLPLGTITQLVTGNLAVRSTTNLTAASGGTAADSAADAREDAFARPLRSDRVVSVDDCIAAALGVSGVIAAALDPATTARSVKLVVAMAGRRDPTPEDLEAVRTWVAGAMPVTARVPLEIAPATQRAVHLVVEIGVRAGVEPADVLMRVRTAFGAGPDGFFAAARWDIGEPLRLGAIYDALFHVDGVDHARVLWMADSPLPEGESPPASAPDVFDPGATGVVRCDNDPVADPFGRRGTFRLQQVQEADA